MLARPRRSVLYMPGSNAKAVAKAKTLPADALILDLEDSVAPDAKIAARGQVAEAVRAGGFGAREVVIRVNGPHTPWGEDDLVAASATGPDAILLPKVDGAGRDHGRRPDACAKAGAPDRTRIWAMMETPNAILNAGSIAAVAADPTSRLAVMVMGLNDLAKETRARLDPGRPGHDGLARDLRARGPRPWRRHHRRRLQRHPGSRRLPRSNACKAGTWASTARR